MMPPTPLQNSYSSFDEEQEHFEVEDQIWRTRDRTVIARTRRYLEVSQNTKGPDDSDVDLRRIIEEARDKKGCAVFETFRTDGPSEFLVASRSRWDKHQRRRNTPWGQNSSASSSERQWQEDLEEQRAGWSSLERKVTGAMENDLENCVHIKSGH